MVQFFPVFMRFEELRFKIFCFDRNFSPVNILSLREKCICIYGVPRGSRELVEKQITSYYPDAVVEETPAPNILLRGMKWRVVP